MVNEQENRAATTMRMANPRDVPTLNEESIKARAMEKDPSFNVLGSTLAPCSTDPMTGFFRNGACDTCASDQGSHTVCVIMTDEFLAFSKYLGNDLSTPRPEYGFPGLKAGDSWCLCASRLLQAHDEGCAPQVNLHATHVRALEIVSIDVLRAYATQEPEG